ncbi:MAG TPA: dihydrofolate reductase [Gaiellaceae bacterium]|nr:dihydrofolate reductase [Gaiellaceae bacterium]
MSFDVVVAADLDWGIGKSQGLPWPRLRGDLRHFKQITTHASPGKRNAVVMGRKTWQSKEVGERPLPGRLNIVVSRSALRIADGVLASSSLDEAIAVPSDVESTFVIGGAGLYAVAIAHLALRYVYLTRVAGRFACDVHVPDLDDRFVRVDWDGEFAAEDNGVSYRVERLARRS